MSNKLENLLRDNDQVLFGRLQECKDEVRLLLQKYSKNFPKYTDHSIEHSLTVSNHASNVLSDEEISNLNIDEIYILLMSCYLHDIGMCIPPKKIKEFESSVEFIKYSQRKSNQELENFLREIHHDLSYDFILKEWRTLKIPTKKYAEAIALVSRGHRKVNLSDSETYKPKFFVREGREFVCVPFLSCVLRIADEIDITNARTPELLCKYYLPENKKSKLEYEKHKATYLINIDEDTLIINAKCSDQNIYNALIVQSKKINNTINYCQKVIRSLGNTNNRTFNLSLANVETKIDIENFIPKDIGFSFDVNNVVNTFIGEHLYKDKYVAIREVLQNSIDTCKYKKSLVNSYNPCINVILDNKKLIIVDNGLGMDEFIVSNYFSRLAKSYYRDEKITQHYDSIGQFGVGVFAYFLVCDYFEVETKMNGKEALKFRVDKNPDTYFYFYKKISAIKEGTKITLFLKEEFTDKLKFENLVSLTKQHIRYLDIPIVIKNKDKYETIMQNDLSLSFEKETFQRIKLVHQDKITNLKLITAEHDCEDFNGCCGMYMFFKNERFLPSYINNLFEDDFRNRFNISVSHKGIYVKQFSKVSLKNIFGKINVKKGNIINLARDGFQMDLFIKKICTEFEKQILTTVFSSWSDLEPSERTKYTYEFLSNCIEDLLSYHDNYHDDFLKLIENAYFGHIRTPIPETSGQHFGNIRTAFRNIRTPCRVN